MFTSAKKKNTQFQTPFAENVKTLPDFIPKCFNQIQPKGAGTTKLGGGGGGGKNYPLWLRTYLYSLNKGSPPKLL